MQVLAKFIIILFLSTMVFKQGIVCQLSNIEYNTTADTDFGDDDQDGRLILLEEFEFVITGGSRIVYVSNTLAIVLKHFIMHNHNQNIVSPIAEVHTPPPNGV